MPRQINLEEIVSREGHIMKIRLTWRFRNSRSLGISDRRSGRCHEPSSLFIKDPRAL